MADESSSDVDLCNRALRKLDAGRITDLNDKTERGQQCRENYVPQLYRLLSEHPWAFATKRVELSPATPVAGWTYAHDLPNDMVQMSDLADNDEFRGTATFPHQREGNLILSNAPQVFLRYVYKFTNVVRMPYSFQEALALRIAAAIAEPIGRSAVRAKTLREEADQELAKAKGNDGQDEIHEQFDDENFAWIAGR